MENLKPRDIIGNTVSVEHGGKSIIVTILAASPERIAYKIDGKMCHGPLSQALGILLTPEILTDNLGLKQFKNKGTTIIEYASFSENGFESFVVFCIDINKGLRFAGRKHDVKHVHEIQGLYYLLIYEELTFKHDG